MVKIIQIVTLPDDGNWRGHVLGLGDDGVTYIDQHLGTSPRWVVYIPNRVEEGEADAV